MPRVALYVCLGQTLLAQGKLDQAREVMLTSDQVAVRNSVVPSFRARHAAYRVMFAIRLNDLAGAVEWGQRLTEYTAALGLEFQHVPLRLLIALGKTEQAARQLDELYMETETTGARGLGITLRIYQALCSETTVEAINYLRDALVRGEAGGYVRTFVDEAQLLTPLLHRALAQRITPDYIAKLISIIESEKRTRPFQGAQESAGEPGLLSKRELEILNLLEKGLSNRQISERLIISLNTTKRHIHNIFEKLDAKTRTQAISRARVLKLI